MKVRTLRLTDLNPASYNPRVELAPGDPEYERLARSLDEFGLVEPLVWNERTGNLVGGHQRLRVLLDRGVTETEVSVVDLSPEREKALNVALNKITGRWDEQRLAALLDELAHLDDFDVTLTGFEMPEVRSLVAEHLAADVEERFDLEAELARIKTPVTKPGDLIVLGEHRLLCGDSTSAGDVRRLMDGERAALFATDPPYMVGYDGTNHPGSPKSRRGAKKNKDWSGTYGVTWDDAEANPEFYDAFVRCAVDEAVRPDAAWYCWHASKRQAMVEQAWERAGAFVHCQIIWAKNRPVLTRTWYAWRHEPCFFGWVKPPKGKKPPRHDKSVLSTVWEVDTLANGVERPDHPTPKPTVLFEVPMRQHTRGGEACYEPFAGSGSQVIAAQRLGRRCFALEISPVYCDVIVRRFMAVAGEGAVDRKLAKKYALPAAPGEPASAPALAAAAGGGR